MFFQDLDKVRENFLSAQPKILIFDPLNCQKVLKCVDLVSILYYGPKFQRDTTILKRNLSSRDSISGARPVPKIERKKSGTFRNERSGTSVENMLENHKNILGPMQCRFNITCHLCQASEIFGIFLVKNYFWFKKRNFKFFDARLPNPSDKCLPKYYNLYLSYLLNKC